MIDKATFLRKIDEAYALRVAGDVSGVAAFFAPDAVFRMAGASRLMADDVAGPANAGPAIESLIADFQHHSVERLEAVVEGNKAAVRSRVEISVRGGERHSAETFDLFVVNDEGLVTSMTQFPDTALLVRLLGELKD